MGHFRIWNCFSLIRRIVHFNFQKILQVRAFLRMFLKWSEVNRNEPVLAEYFKRKKTFHVDFRHYAKVSEDSWLHQWHIFEVSWTYPKLTDSFKREIPKPKRAECERLLLFSKIRSFFKTIKNLNTWKHFTTLSSLHNFTIFT